ncbi:transporter substrate-binding domain-containing protein [Moraxella bovis]|uniref:transporter substrate-binding domain-containing protein n=1 Tax=Moraxella bovis TaxID=476 RepID=UPI002226AE98|nr:transporter substrate-binding domain-containing protein [Moraxella bovis]UYZ71426.1 transporter substrate-binding domain-containing protein [Moraxella bovis]UYZ72661.1 transporter substrate-binding domain-containing protein [Moraxella bovis]UZA14720.1 transporter substrate-binding domain-containing protein [Moraxella bovis]UZA42539.1 transporter substrate-binding domain-containing protein [Moraxella bovis]
MKRTALVALIGTLLLTACGSHKLTNTKTTTGTNNTIQTLRIVTEGEYAPFNSINNDGSLAGFDVDIANALCAKMAVTCEISTQNWGSIIPALKTGKFDAIVSAMSVTPERSEQVSFSEPYFVNTLVFVAKNDSSFDPANADNIKSAKISAQGSTISSQWLTQTYPDVKPTLHSTLVNAFLDLGASRSDVVISDKMPAMTWLGSELGKDFAVKGDEIDINDNFAIAVDKGNDELLAKFNQALADIKADGTYDKIVIEHFGESMVSK